MLDRKLIRSNPEGVARAIAAKGYDIDTKRWLRLDAEVRERKSAMEKIQAEKNAASRKIPSMEDAEKKKLLASLRKLDTRFAQERAKFTKIEAELQQLERELPNLPLPDVTTAKDASENEVLREVGAKTPFSFQPKEYLELAATLDLLDMQRAAKISGARFGILKRQLAVLEFSLLQYGITKASENGYIPLVTPVMIKEEIMGGMGYLARHGDQETYHLKDDRLYLVGTAEQAIGGMHADEVLDADELPLRYVGFSSAFRREAGSYGKDTKGILRVHQFDKLEFFSLTLPEQSDAEHTSILALEESLMQDLQLPYRVLKMVSGDLGVPAARKYDIEAWMPGQSQYRETHSCSSCTDYQARGLNIRYKGKGSIGFVHTLNGTVFAIGRTLIAIMENYQQADGSIKIPKALQPYAGFSVIRKGE